MVLVSAIDMINNKLLLSDSSHWTTVQRLLDALRFMTKKYGNGQRTITAIPQELFSANKVVITPRQAFFSQQESVEFVHSAGRIAGETITFYPPGVPVLCPGELITQETIAAVKKQQNAGMRVVGPVDCTLENIRVVRN